MASIPVPGAGERSPARTHPRTIGWLGTTALAMGGSNQSLFIVGALIAAQGSAAVPLLIAGLLLSWAALPGWTELIMMWPDRVGGIAATCAEAFRPYSPVLANLCGVCYWWGWVPTCGVTAILSASALHQWYVPSVSVPLLASAIVVVFAAVNLIGVRWATRVAIPIACGAALLALCSTLIPVLSGHVDWAAAGSFHLDTPFHGFFGSLTSAMAGLYLIGFAAPAFEAAACHVGETRDWRRNVPRAMFASAGMATLFFVAIPVIWLGVIGPAGLGGDLTRTLGPTFAPALGTAARTAAIWFMVLNMFHGTLQPLAGASRTLAQLSEDGLLPRVLARRSSRDVPAVATVLTAAMSIAFLLAGDPTWMIAGANLCYLIAIGLPSIAVMILRRIDPGRERPWRAPPGTIVLGVVAASAWGFATVFGFSQFGLPTVLFSLTLAYSGSVLYAWRSFSDRRRAGERTRVRSLHLKLTGAMLAVIALDGAGYLLAVTQVDAANPELIVVLEDIFVLVTLLTISVGLILPGMVSHAVGEVAAGARRLAAGTVGELTEAMIALADGRLDAAHAQIDVARLDVRSRDEIGAMANSFNEMQDEVARAAVALDGARESLRRDRAQLAIARDQAVEASQMKSAFLANMSHEIRTPMNGVIGMNGLLLDTRLDAEQLEYAMAVSRSGEALLAIINDILDFSKIEAGKVELDRVAFDLGDTARHACTMFAAQADEKGIALTVEIDDDFPRVLGDPMRARQVIGNLVSNAVKFTRAGRVVVRVGARNRAGDVLDVRVEVIDTGIGIDAAAAEQLFEPFTQADASTTRNYGGTGLGLAISKQLIEAMGGRIGVAGELGRGATFWFEVSLPVSQLGDPSPGVPARPLPRRGAGTPAETAPLILVAEDSPVNQVVAMRMLDRCGFRSELVSDGRSALLALSRQPYAAVLMDCHMPELDGYATTREIRRREVGRRRTPIIAMTANALSGDREKCLAAGMDDYLSKPVRREALAGALDRWVATPDDGAPDDGAPDGGAPDPPADLVPVGAAPPPTDPSADAAAAAARYFEVSHDLVCTADFDGFFQQLNAQWTETLGWSQAELRARPFVEFVHPDDREATRHETARLARGGETIDFVNRYATRDGGWRWIDWRAVAVAADGLIYASARDVTERLAGEAALAASERQTRLILETARDAFIAFDAAGLITDWNPQAQASFGWSREEVLGRPWAPLAIPEGRRAAHRERIECFLATGQAGELGNRLERTVRHRDGHEFPVELTMSALETESGWSFNVFLCDITERKRAEAELARARDEALEASKMKSMFVANVSHEIRTPMNGVIGMTELLLSTQLAGAQREYAETIASSGEALLAIIDDILDFSKIEAGKLELDQTDFDLREAIERACSMLAPRAHAKGLELVVAVDPAVPGRVQGDAARLRQVIVNLVSNAIKFTAAGEVVLRVGSRQAPGGPVLVRVAVSDTGIGIRAEALGKLFAPFSQADGSTTRKYGGTGLGLAISRQLIELMGGRLGAESQPGQGSSFWFELPLGPGAPPAADERDLAGLRVLVVDENATSRQILAGHLTSWRTSWEVAASAADGLERLRAAATGTRPFELVLLDLNVADGWGLIRTIRNQPALTAIRLVALTSAAARAGAPEEDDFDGVLIKPVGESRLYAEIQSVIARERPAPDRDPAAPAPLPAAATGPDARPVILVVEDTAVNQAVAVHMLERCGFRGRVAENGRRALEALDHESFAGVLMDCQMPELDGYETTAEIRRHETAGRRLPIIAMTANSMQGDRERCLAAGMDDYLTKPLRNQALKQALATWVARSPDAEPLDGEVVGELERLDGDGLTGLLSLYFDQAAGDVSELRGAIGRGDARAISQTAHRLKGASGMIGAAQVSHRASELEAMAESGDLATANGLLDALGCELDATREVFAHPRG